MSLFTLAVFDGDSSGFVSTVFRPKMVDKLVDVFKQSGKQGKHNGGGTINAKLSYS